MILEGNGAKLTVIESEVAVTALSWGPEPEVAGLSHALAESNNAWAAEYLRRHGDTVTLIELPYSFYEDLAGDWTPWSFARRAIREALLGDNPAERSAAASELIAIPVEQPDAMLLGKWVTMWVAGRPGPAEAAMDQAAFEGDLFEGYFTPEEEFERIEHNRADGELDLQAGIEMLRAITVRYGRS